MAKNRGLTIIELLVVISILSFLVVTLVANVNSLRVKAEDTSIRVDLNNLFTFSSDYYTTQGDYDNLCDEEKAQEIINSINAPASKKKCNTSADHTAWVACAPAVEKQGLSWCIDSTGLKTAISSKSCSDYLTSCSGSIGAPPEN